MMLIDVDSFTFSQCGVQPGEKGCCRPGAFQPDDIQGNQVTPPSKSLGPMASHPPRRSGVHLVGEDVCSAGRDCGAHLGQGLPCSPT